MTPVIDRTYTLAEVPAAMGHLEAGPGTREDRHHGCTLGRDLVRGRTRASPVPSISERADSNDNTKSTTSTMNAIVQAGYGPPERVLTMQEVDRPPVGDEDVMIRVLATSVNTPDWIAVTGVPYILRLQSGLRRPKTPVRGTDVAGVVEAVGTKVTDFRPGDEVFGSAWADRSATSGTFAEFTVVPSSQLVAKPASVTFEEAAASVMSGITALIAMRDVGKAAPGSHVLVNGASGGVGTLAVQIAKALGAEVTGVSSTKNLEFVAPWERTMSSTTRRTTSRSANRATTSSWTM